MSPISGQTSLIALMGSTGSGKSSFVNAILGKPQAAVESGLRSSTTHVEQYIHLRKSGGEVRIVDPPGFNDHGIKSDLKVLQMIAAFLNNKYDVNQKLSGIIFLHNINDAPLDWQNQRRNAALFKRLCGTGSMKNVIVVTSFWDALFNMDEGIQKEHELQTRDGFLQELHAGGARFVRCGHFEPGKHPADSAFYTPEQVLEYLLNLNLACVEMQKERPNSAPVIDALAKPCPLEERLKVESQQGLEKTGQDLEATRLGDKVDVSHQEQFMQMEEKIQGRLDRWDKSAEDLQTTLTQLQAQVATKEEFEALRHEVMQLRQADHSLRLNDQRRIDELNQALVRLRKERDDLAEECKVLRLGNDRDLYKQLQELIMPLAKVTRNPELERIQSLFVEQADELRQAKQISIDLQKKLDIESQLYARSRLEAQSLRRELETLNSVCLALA